MKKIIKIFLLSFPLFLNAAQDQLQPCQPRVYFDFDTGKAIPILDMPTVIVGGAEGISQTPQDKDEDTFLTFYPVDETDFLVEDFAVESLLTPSPEEDQSKVLAFPGDKIFYKVAPSRSAHSRPSPFKTFRKTSNGFECLACRETFLLPHHFREHREKQCFLSKKDSRIKCCFCSKQVGVGALSQHLNRDHRNQKVTDEMFKGQRMKRCPVKECFRVFFGTKRTRLEDHMKADHKMLKAAIRHFCN